MDKVIIFSLVLLVVGVFMFVGTAKTVQHGIETESWPAISGNMQFAKILQKASGDNTDEVLYYPEVGYVYTVDNVRYQGTQLFAYQYTTTNKEILEDILSPFQNTSIINVFYDVENPANAVLITGAKESQEVSKFNVGSILMIVGGILFFYRSFQTGIM